MTEITIQDISPLLRRLWQSKWIILFLTLAGFFGGLALTVDTQTVVTYRATSSVYVTYTTYQDQSRGSSTIKSYSDLIKSGMVCERAAELLEDTGVTAAKIPAMIDNWITGNSYVMYINATASEPQLAVRVANAVAQAFTEKVAEVSGNNSLQVLDQAYRADTRTDSSHTKLIIATAAPFLLACLWIVAGELLTGKLRYLSQCAPDPEELLAILPDTRQ